MERLREPRKAIYYQEQALAMDQKNFGDEHENIARESNNLGEAWRALGDHQKAIPYLSRP